MTNDNCPTPPPILRNKYDEMILVSDQIDKLIALRDNVMMIENNSPQYGNFSDDTLEDFYRYTGETMTKLRKRLYRLITNEPEKEEEVHFVYECTVCEDWSSEDLKEVAKHHRDNPDHSIGRTEL